ncbi:MAG TPA: FtsX-like permease family protein [Methanospirillum sp.]|nr:FtsX-like permease family protein [Methanospirillum sp.]
MKDIIFAMALRNVKINYLRSILAAVGITIGIISIACMGMLGTNMTGSVTDSLSSMADKLTVSPYSGKGGGGGGAPGASSGSDNLTKSQYKSIVKIANKYGYVYGLHSIRDKVKKGKDEWSTTVYGIEESAMKTILNNLTEGGYPSSDNSVLIGPTFASDNNFQIGSKFTIGSQGVKVSGIIESRGMSMDMNTDNAVVVTKSMYESMYGAKDEYNQVNIVLDNIDDVSVVSDDIDTQMNRREETVRVQDSSRMVSMISSSVTTITSFATLIASISLLVAAVSIFNIMMMSVTERIREIGVLRSIGTQKKEILRMFVYEATLIGVLGATIGMVLSLAMGYVFILIMVGSTKYFFTYDSLIHLPYAMAVGLIICILSGLYPAWRGANMDPIEALRAD